MEPEIYRQQARKFKHQADKLSDPCEKGRLYIEATQFFVLCCHALEKNGYDPSTVKVYIQTIRFAQ